MKKSISILILFLIFTLTFSCKEDDHDCSGIGENNNEVDNTEISIMEECFENRLTSKEEVEENLIGEWELVGFGNVWGQPDSQLCIHLTISEEEIIIETKNSDLDTIVRYPWEIASNISGTYLRLSVITLYISGTRPPRFISGLGAVDVFCSKYMYQKSLTPVDGNMYLYEKIK